MSRQASAKVVVAVARPKRTRSRVEIKGEA
jgi:hypothetical protein